MDKPINSKSDLDWAILALVLGIFSFSTLLAFHNYTDGDMWAKLAIGASVWLRGDFIRHDIFAFTPVLPKYIDHEWGAGFIWYGLINFFGPTSLMFLKILLALGTLAFPVMVARRRGCQWPAILLLVLPAGFAILPGFVPVIRSHTFTYFFFALTLFCLEEMWRGKRWPCWILAPLMVIWTNVHGGFVAGLGTISAYTGFYTLRCWITRRASQSPEASTDCESTALWAWVGTASTCWLVTLINPYGFDFWRYLLPALLHPRVDIAEWHPLPLFANDAFIGFRILFFITLVVILFGWRFLQNEIHVIQHEKTQAPLPRKTIALLTSSSWPGLFMLALTAYLAWKSRRHAPFFGAAVMAFAVPFLENIFAQLRQKQLHVPLKLKPALLVALIHLIVAIFIADKFLPKASIYPLSPIGHDPVREVDILSLAQAEGNLAVPFAWGSYSAWRLFPRIKVSTDGRYETTYPEETFHLSQDFFNKQGAAWDRLVQKYPVDYVILDLKYTALRPEDLKEHGYVEIWRSGEFSALLVKTAKAPFFQQVARDLPPHTINPLDANIPKGWWGK